MATEFTASCRSVLPDNDNEQFVCQLRHSRGNALSDIEIEKDDGNDIEFSTQNYKWNTHTTAFYFLVETLGLSATQLEQFSKFLNRAAFPVGKQKMAIATVGKTTEERAALGSYRRKLEDVAQSIANLPSRGGSSDILNALETTTEKISIANSDRTAIIVLARADLPDNATKSSSIVQMAQAKNISIFFVVDGETTADKPSAVVSRIASQTKGTVINLAGLSDANMLAEASGISDKVENGLVATLDATQLPQKSQIKIRANVAGSSTKSSDRILLLRQTEKGPSDFGGWLSWLAIAGLAAGLILLGRSLMPAHRTTQPGVPAPPIHKHAASSPGPVQHSALFIADPTWLASQRNSAVAWFHFENSGEPPLPFAAGRVRVGRSRDNDIQLTDRSVHRHHAVLEVSNSGAVSVSDLQTKNGIYVNGQRCDSNELNIGDVLELGNVKLRMTTTIR